MITDKTLEQALQKYFNLKSFRQGQKGIISDVLAGKDVLGVLPTGTGKSLCYQLPAQLLPGQTIVVSPLISLMVDQVKQLKAQGFKRVVAINSLMSFEERQSVYEHLKYYRLIYVSPEILQQPQLLQRFKRLKISLFVIDEAHCISQWGHEFRPDYLRLEKIIEQLNHPPLLALSATVTPQVKQDIIQSLNRPQMIQHIYPIDRENIVLNIKQVQDERAKKEFLLNFFNQRRLPTLIYFSSRQSTEKVAKFLQKNLPLHRVAFYHGGMDSLDRTSVQQQFMNDQLDIVCCTSAFGMGVDKPDIRLIIHYHIPTQIESFIQEIGRAGRDGRESISLILYQQEDIYIPKRLIKNELPSDKTIQQVFKQLKRLYDQNKKIPIQESEIIQIFDCDLIQWRFLFYQFEKSDIIKDNRIYYDPHKWRNKYDEIINLRNNRLKYKTVQLNEMINWLQSKECLRKTLYKKFQSSYTTVEQNCCHVCGFSISDGLLEEPLGKKEHAESWEQLLKKIFFTKGSYESEKNN